LGTLVKIYTARIKAYAYSEREREREREIARSGASLTEYREWEGGREGDREKKERGGELDEGAGKPLPESRRGNKK